MSAIFPRDAQASVALFTDLYELTMAQAYSQSGLRGRAVFELFFRELPPSRNFAVAAGLDALLCRLEQFRFRESELSYLSDLGRFSDSFLDDLASFRFSGDVWAVPEGTAVFPHEPLVQVVAPIVEAQIIETLVLNQVHAGTVAASKAARVVLAAGGRSIIDFGARRAHGVDAGLAVARAAYLVGCDGTSLVEAGRQFGIPVFGTMAHSFIQAHDNEAAAFENFARAYPNSTLLVDTYDTLEGVGTVIELSRRLGDAFRVSAVRLDSGDLVELARKTRVMLDEAGLPEVRIVASGGLDEYKLLEFATAEPPINAYGVGTSLAVSDDAPTLDMAYKLVEYDGKPRTKLSSSKSLYPERKQVFRQSQGETFCRDVLAPFHSDPGGMPLLGEVVHAGEALPAGCVPLEESRLYACDQLRRLPEAIRQLTPAPTPYRVDISAELQSTLDRLRREHQSS